MSNNQKSNSYQFIYNYNNPYSLDCKVVVIRAKTVLGACGKFIRSRKNKWPFIDHEVMDMSTRNFIDISGIKSVKQFVS